MINKFQFLRTTECTLTEMWTASGVEQLCRHCTQLRLQAASAEEQCECRETTDMVDNMLSTSPDKVSRLEAQDPFDDMEEDHRF